MKKVDKRVEDNKNDLGYLVIYRITLILIGLLILISFYFGFRIYIGDWFQIPTNSMYPTLIPGDRVIVNKLIAGARVYDEFNFEEGARLVSHRTTGIRGVKHNDIVIFNCPIDRLGERIQFEINYVYCKRCIALPGDTISIINGNFRNNNFNGVLGDEINQKKLSQTPSSSIQSKALIAMPYDSKNYSWTIKDLGPLFVPKMGSELIVDSISYKPYKMVIEFESGKRISTTNNGNVLLGDSIITKYIFTKNYYFMCGDNVLNSIDSRYWGFVPEDFIIGVVSHIIYSRDKKTNKFKKDRLLKKVTTF